MDADTVHQAAVDTFNTKQDVDGVLADLKSLVESLIESWRGAGSTAFSGVMEVWNTESADLMEALQGIGEMLDSSGTAATETDETDASSFANLL
ncbi:WXG100 family type VII secretion target [Glycomyces endophyticus]